jgi:hypothetical protein
MADELAPDTPSPDAPPKREPLRITIGPKSDMTPGPPGGAEDTPTDLTATQRGIQGLVEKIKPDALPHVGDDDAGQALFETLKPGQKFTDSAGKVFTKPWIVEDDSDFEKVPEGASFVDKEGNKFKKPEYEPLSVTAETLYQMAQTDDAKEQALKVVYGDKVKRDPGGALYVDEDGTLRKPGRGLTGAAGNFVAQTAPAAGLGLGSVFGPAGETFGAALGRQFNNSILALAGVHQSAEEQTTSAGWEGAGVAVGAPIGKAVAAVPGAVKAAGGAVSNAGRKLYKTAGDVAGGALGRTLESIGVGPDLARYFLGISSEKAGQASDIAARTKGGSPLSPKVMFQEAPMLHKIQEFNQIFSGDRFGQAQEAFANQEAASLLEQYALKLDEPVTQATKLVPSEAAGRAVLEAAQRDLAHDDALLDNLIRGYQEKAILGIEAETDLATKRLAMLEVVQQQAGVDAHNVLKGSLDGLREQVTAAGRLAGDNGDPSALNRMIAAQYDAYDTGIRARARDMYGAARAVTRGAPFPNTARLAASAEAFLRSVPEQVRNKYPSEISDLARLVDPDVIIPNVAGPKTRPQGEPFQSLDWAGLHHLRSWLRYGIDYNDMTPDMRQGSLKLFAREVNAVLHDPSAPPQLQEAARLLDQADAFYRENIPFLNDHMVKSVMKELETGVGVDAKAIAKVLIDPERTAAMRRARGIIGENGWRAVEAAHVQNMLDKSRTAVPGEYDFTKFAAQVEEQIRNGVIDTAYSPAMASRLREMVGDIRRFRGDLPIRAGATDTISTIMQRGAAAKAEADRIALTDPVKAIQDEIAKLAKHEGRGRAMIREKQGPLKFLFDPEMSDMAVTAANKIIDNPDLLRLSAQYFSPDSEEFNALRQVAVQRWIQRPLDKMAGMRRELADERTGMSEETQALLFPGVTRNMMQTFVKDMEFLLSSNASDIGGTLAGGSRVLNPAAHSPIPKGWITKAVTELPGVAAVHRVLLGKAYNFVMDAVSHPQFAHWLAGRLEEGTPEARFEARQLVQQRLRAGRFAGAAVGQQTLSGPASGTYPEPQSETVH